MPERLINQIANQGTTEKAEHQVPPIDGFLKDCLTHKVYLSLDYRRRNLIGIYLGTTKVTLDDLRSLAQVTTRERVRQLIKSGLTKMWQQLPSELQTQYPLEEVLTLKRICSEEARAKMSAARKKKFRSFRTGFGIDSHGINAGVFRSE